jgi:hypothetical protein
MAISTRQVCFGGRTPSSVRSTCGYGVSCSLSGPCPTPSRSTRPSSRARSRRLWGARRQHFLVPRARHRSPARAPLACLRRTRRVRLPPRLSARRRNGRCRALRRRGVGTIPAVVDHEHDLRSDPGQAATSAATAKSSRSPSTWVRAGSMAARPLSTNGTVAEAGGRADAARRPDRRRG